jgi:DNA polymerase-4
MPSLETLIIHVDVDAFFASVEQLLIPSLHHRPVVVGSGCIASCSYEARRFGLHAGMPLSRARRLCPQAVILPGRCGRYRCFAEQIWAICRRTCLSLETYLDEAYGEVPGPGACGGGDPVLLGQRLQDEVRQQAGLPVSIGLADNRMLAKMASHRAKPGGVRWIRPQDVEAFLAPLAVEDLLGVGGTTARLLGDLNVRTIADLRQLSRAALVGMLGQRGEALYERCRGRDVALPHRRPRPPRSISRETTFHRPCRRSEELRGMLLYLLERAMHTAREAGLLVGTVELTIRYDDSLACLPVRQARQAGWKQHTGARTLAEPTDNDDEVFTVLCDLLGRLHTRRVALRHVGVVLSHFRPVGERGRLMEPPDRSARRRLYGTIDTIRHRFGHAAVVTGESIELLGRLQQDDYGFVLRTPSLTK